MRRLIAENWLPVSGFEGWYEVSDLGRVRSLMTHSKSNYVERRTPLLIAAGKRKDGRGGVRLRKKDGRRRVGIGVLVLETFRGAAPSGTECSHINEDPSDDRLCNLIWESHRDNILRRSPERASTPYRGENNGRAIISDIQALEMAELKRSGVRSVDIAVQYCVCREAVDYNIRNRARSVV